jgi:hypothetical protein
MLKQCGLADPRLPAHHEHTAAPSPRRVEQLAERRAFRETIEQHHMPHVEMPARITPHARFTLQAACARR